jgi:diketogulonate reductase-like aldo/keto reductase
VRDVADDLGCTASQAAIAWLLRREEPQLVPILGVRSAEQLADNLGAVDVALTAEHRALLDAAAAPQLGFPRAFLESDGVRELIYGETWELLYSRRERPRDTAPAG